MFAKIFDANGVVVSRMQVTSEDDLTAVLPVDYTYTTIDSLDTFTMLVYTDSGACQSVVTDFVDNLDNAVANAGTLRYQVYTGNTSVVVPPDPTLIEPIESLYGSIPFSLSTFNISGESGGRVSNLPAGCTLTIDGVDHTDKITFTSGSYRCDIVPEEPGEYDVVISKDGYTPLKFYVIRNGTFIYTQVYG